VFQEFKATREPRPLPTGLRIRAATLEDGQALAAISVERHGGDLANRLERVRSQLASAGSRFDLHLLVAELAGEVVGFGRTGYHHWKTPADRGAPEGWYLQGVIVRPPFRECGIGRELTRCRLGWIAGKADEAYSFTNARNSVSIALHVQLGFVELTRDFAYPDASFDGGEGILFRLATLQVFRQATARNKSAGPEGSRPAW